MQIQTPQAMEQQIAQLEQEVEEYRTLLDSIPVGLWFKDTSNRVMRVNKAAAQFEGKSVEEIEGKSSYQLYPKEVADGYYQDDMEVIQSGKAKYGIIEPHVIPSTGEEMWVETGKVPYYNKCNTVNGVIAFAIDITEKQRIAQQLTDTQQTFTDTLSTIAQMLEGNENTDIILDYIKNVWDSID